MRQCQLRSTPAFSEELRITVKPTRGVCWFFVLLHFSEAESRVLKWDRHCRFYGMMYLAALPWKGIPGSSSQAAVDSVTA